MSGLAISTTSMIGMDVGQLIHVVLRKMSAMTVDNWRAKLSPKMTTFFSIVGLGLSNILMQPEPMIPLSNASLDLCRFAGGGPDLSDAAPGRFDPGTKIPDHFDVVECGRKGFGKLQP